MIGKEDNAEKSSSLGPESDEKKGSEPKKGKDKKKLMDKLKKTWEDIWDIDKEFSRISQFIVKTIKISTVSFNKFLNDDCLSRASSIAYTTIVSLIPTLTVGFSLFSAFGGMGARKEVIIKMAEQYIKDHNMNIDISPYTQAIGSVTDNAAGIGGVGLLVLIFSATAVLRTLEKTFNDIWKIKVQRSILMKVIYYWSALTLGPLLLATGGSLAGILANFFTMPTIRHAQFADADKSNLWIIGDRGLIRNADRDLKNATSLNLKSIDYDNQKAFLFEGTERLVIRSANEEEKTVTDLNETNLKKAEFTGLDIKKQRIRIISRDGLLLVSHDAGKNWNVIRIGSIDQAGAFAGLEMNDIHFKNNKVGFIAAANGHLIKTMDGGQSWSIANIKFNTKRTEIISQELNSIYFIDVNRGYILSNKAGLIFTHDGGENWEHIIISDAKVGKKLANLYAMTHFGKEFWIVGENGLILYSKNEGETWLRRNRGDFDYFAAYAFGPGKAIITGKEGYVLSTLDSGENWLRKRKGSLGFYSVLPVDKEIYIFGENMSAYKSDISDEAKIDWSKIKGGKSFWANMINFFAPFVVIWVLFVVAYITLPNSKIPFKPAAIGASVTSFVWVLFIFAFMFYVSNLTGGTRAVYGALAAIPLFLLMIYASSVITLLGAEVTYTIQHPTSYSSKRGIKELSLETEYLFDSINILFTIFKNFEYGKGATSEKKLLTLMSTDPQSLPAILEVYKAKEFIKTTDREGEYLPNLSGRLISMEDILSALFRKSFEIPNYNPGNPLMKYLKDNFDEFDKYRGEKFSRISMEYLVKNLVILKKKSPGNAVEAD
jgi:membrane protein